MTLTAYAPVTYTGTNSTAVYAFGFRILQDADLVVIQTDLAGVETTLVLNTDYTVTGAGAYTGGSITLTAGNLATGYGLLLKRVVAITQPTSIRNQGAFFPEVHENVFDRLTMVDQQQQEEIDRSFKLSPSATAGSVEAPSAEPGYALGWDALGNLTNVPNTGADQTLAWTAADAVVAADAAAATALVRSDLAATTGAGLVGTAGGTLQTLLQPQPASHSDGTNTIVGSGRVFIGNNTPSGDDSALLVGRGLTGSYSTGAHGVRDESSYNPSGTGFIGYSSFDAIPAMTGAVNWNHIHSYQSRIQYSGSVQVGTERGFYHQFTHNGSGTVLQSTGIEVVDYAGTGSVTSQVGVYIGPITRGITSNFGIYSPGATTASFHEGLWQVGIGGIVSGGPIKGPNFYTQDAQNTVAFGDATAVGVPGLDKPGYYCTFIGRGAGGSQTAANYNTLVGAMAGNQCTTNGDNTCLGGYAGYGMIGTGNVFIGKQAGYYETGNNKLFIDNTKRTNEADGRTKALVYGLFDAAIANQFIQINGKFGINGSTPPAKPTVTGSRGGNAALASLLTALASYGFITDSSTA